MNIESLKEIANVKPQDINLSLYGGILLKIVDNYKIACTAEYLIENNQDIDESKAFELATEVHNRMDNDESYNTFERNYVNEVISEYRILVNDKTLKS